MAILNSRALADAISDYIDTHAEERVGADSAAPPDTTLDFWDTPLVPRTLRYTLPANIDHDDPAGEYVERLNQPMDHPWPPQLLVDLALGIEERATVAAKYGMDDAQLEALEKVEAFNSLLLITKGKLHEEGAIFKARAVAQAELLLEQTYRMAIDPSVAAGLRARLIELTVKWAGLDPEINAKQKHADANPVSAVQININMG